MASIWLLLLGTSEKSNVKTRLEFRDERKQERNTPLNVKHPPVNNFLYLLPFHTVRRKRERTGAGRCLHRLGLSSLSQIEGRCHTFGGWWAVTLVPTGQPHWQLAWQLDASFFCYTPTPRTLARHTPA